MTKVALETVDAVRRRLAVEIPAGDVTAEIDRAYDQLRRKARVPGFRQGRAPRSVLERLFGDQVRADVFGRLVSESYAEALRDQQIDPVSQPEIVTEHAVPGEPLRYSATVEVRPAVVRQRLQWARGRAAGAGGDGCRRGSRDRAAAAEPAQLVPITDRRVAQRGDVATVDYEATLDDACRRARRAPSRRGRWRETVPARTSREWRSVHRRASSSTIRPTMRTRSWLGSACSSGW